MKTGHTIEVIGGKIELINCSINPKDEGWSIICPHCGKWIKAKLVWDNDAFEFDLIMEKEET